MNNYVLNKIKNLFHNHDIVVTSRELIELDKRLVCGEIETFNIYLYKGYCIKCKQRLIWKGAICKQVAIIQPYDKDRK
jgi:hypothetical protein